MIWSLIESFKEFSSREQSFLQHRDISSIIGVAPSEFISFPNSSALLLYFKVFQLHPISLNVTFLSDSQLREESLKQAWYEPLKVVFNIAGAAVGSFENLPLRFNGILIEDLFGSSESLTIPLISHYRVQALQQIYKLFGSLDIIGNPIQLINELGGGVLNFFYEPAQGLVKSPEAFGRGLARGSVNLIRTTLHGIFSSASKITGNISRGVALLSFDEDYVRTRLRKEWMRKRRKSKGFGDIILSGASDWGEGAFEGVSGLILDPWRGGSQNGLKGFVRGFGTGLIRAFSKPLVGVFDFTSRTLEGVYQSVGLVENASIYSGRLRPPRALIRYSRIEPFDLVSAKAMDIISEVDELKGKQLDASELELENFQFLVSVAEAKIILVVSSYRLVGAFYQRSNSYSEISSCFSIIFDNLVQVTAQRNYLVITRFKILDGIPKLKFHCIPCKDEEEAYDACSVLNVKLLQLLVEGSIVLNPKKSELWKNEQPIYLEQLPQRIQIDVDLMSLWRSSTHDEDMYWWNFVQRKSDSRGSNLPITERKQETFSNLFKVCRGRTLLVFGTFSLSIINLSGNNHLQEIALDSAAWREIKSTTVLQDSTFVTICLLDDRKLEIQCLDEFEAAQMKIFILHWISRFRPRIESAWIGYSEQWTNITRSFRNLLLNKGINGSILNSEMNNSYMIENLNLVPSPAYSTIFISYWRNDIHVNKTFRAQDRITL